MIAGLVVGGANDARIGGGKAGEVGLAGALGFERGKPGGFTVGLLTLVLLELAELGEGGGPGALRLGGLLLAKGCEAAGLADGGFLFLTQAFGLSLEAGVLGLGGPQGLGSGLLLGLQLGQGLGTGLGFAAGLLGGEPMSLDLRRGAFRVSLEPRSVRGEPLRFEFGGQSAAVVAIAPDAKENAETDGKEEEQEDHAFHEQDGTGRSRLCSRRLATHSRKGSSKSATPLWAAFAAAKGRAKRTASSSARSKRNRA